MTMTELKYASEIEFTKDTPYLALTGELRGVFCDDFGENWPRCNGTALQIQIDHGVLTVFEVSPHWH